jgi:hypothetical protein
MREAGEARADDDTRTKEERHWDYCRQLWELLRDRHPEGLPLGSIWQAMPIPKYLIGRGKPSGFLFASGFFWQVRRMRKPISAPRTR